MVAKKRIGEILIEVGSITETQLQSALARQSEDRRRVGAILLEMGVIDDEAVARALAVQRGLDYLNPVRAEVEVELLKKVPREIAQAHRMIPIKTEDGTVVVASADPLNDKGAEELKGLLGAEIRMVVASDSAIISAIKKHYSA